MTFAYAGYWGPDGLIDSVGRAQPGASVRVFDADGVTPSTLWTTRTKAVVAGNPFPPDAKGNVFFFAEPGAHVMAVTIGSVTTSLTVEVPVDPDEAATDTEVASAVAAGLATATGRAIAFALVFGG